MSIRSSTDPGIPTVGTGADILAQVLVARKSYPVVDAPAGSRATDGSKVAYVTPLAQSSNLHSLVNNRGTLAPVADCVSSATA